ncbi:hypothetical protein ACJ7V3_18445 [Halomonas elongata]
MNQSEETRHGFDMGLDEALALLAKHLKDASGPGLDRALALLARELENVSGFDGERFREELNELVALKEQKLAQPDDLLSTWNQNDYMHGYKRSIEALRQEGLGGHAVQQEESLKYLQGP